MTQRELFNEYFTWLYNLVCKNRYSNQTSYNKLLTCLHDIEFKYLLAMDGNRAEDGKSLRYRFALDICFDRDPEYITNSLVGPCSVLEMMVALAVHCEEDIMDDPAMGNRTGQWFWRMIVNLGLGHMSDDKFDERVVRDAISRFLNREYEPDGRGGLFVVRGCDRDLRTVEIWHQLCWYLDTIT